MAGKAEEGRERTEGFDSPQEAVDAYLECLKSRDMKQAVNTFYLRTYLEEYSFEAYAQCQMPRLFGWQDIGLPPGNDFARAAMGEDQEAELERNVERQGMIVCLLDQYLENPERDFEEHVLDWGSMEILGPVPEKSFTPLEDIRASRTDFDEEMEKMALGADRLESLAVGCEIGGRKYLLFMEVIEYGGKWYNKSFGTPISEGLGVPKELMGMIPSEMLREAE